MLPFNPVFISPSCVAVKCKSYAETEINKCDLGRNNFMSLLSLLRGVYRRCLIVHKYANHLAFAKKESNSSVRRVYSLVKWQDSSQAVLQLFLLKQVCLVLRLRYTYLETGGEKCQIPILYLYEIASGKKKGAKNSKQV